MRESTYGRREAVDTIWGNGLRVQSLGLWKASATGVRRGAPVARAILATLLLIAAQLSPANAVDARFSRTIAHTILIDQPVSPLERILAAPGWNEGNVASAFSPQNRRGTDPSAIMTTAQQRLGMQGQALSNDRGVGSADYQFDIPVVSLPGRNGFDLNLNLHYNSGVWQKFDSSTVSFDTDADWLAPGWSFGFGKLVLACDRTQSACPNSSFLVDAVGTRYPSEWLSSGNNEGNNETRIADRSRIHYTQVWKSNCPSSDDCLMLDSATAEYSDGKWVEFKAGRMFGPGSGELFPTTIRDSNGNELHIQYVDDEGPQISAIIDTLGRTVHFWYDNAGRLTTISAPQYGGVNETAIARLHYGAAFQLTATAGQGFDSKMKVLPDTPPTVVPIDAVYLPQTATGYWFGDNDSYSSYGMLAKVAEQSQMSFTAQSWTREGTVTEGETSHEWVYDFPLTNDPTLTDVPRYTSATETWLGMTTPPAKTTYKFVDDPAHQVSETTVGYPNGTCSVQSAYSGLTGQDSWKNGLAYEDDMYALCSDVGHLNPIAGTTTDWQTVGAIHAQRHVDAAGTTTRAYQYDGSVFSAGKPSDVSDLDYDGTVLRRAHTDYVSDLSYGFSDGYGDRFGSRTHMLGLPKSTQLFDGSNSLLSRTDYVYDGDLLGSTPDLDPTLHSPAYDIQSNLFDPNTNYRGNLTQITRYADVSAPKPAGAIVENRVYDDTGNLVWRGGDCCVQEGWIYSVATQYAYPDQHTIGDARAQMSSGQTYDFSTGWATSSTDVNGRTTLYTYDLSRAPKSVSATATYATGALSTDVTDYAPTDPQAVRSETLTTAISVGSEASRQTTEYDGRLSPTLVRQLVAPGLTSRVDMQYDELGRLTAQTLPYNDDGSEQPHWIGRWFDALGRVGQVIGADKTPIATYTYNESARPASASDAPGETVRTTDGWGRERWSRNDALGNFAEVVTPDPNGDGSVLPGVGSAPTTYSYSPLGDLISVNDGDQHRDFQYDGLQRLVRQYLPEEGATLDADGRHSGQDDRFSDIFGYDNRSNLVSHIDARGVKTVYDYNDDPLNRLQDIAHDDSDYWDAANPIVESPMVTFNYVSTGDLTRPSAVSAQDVSDLFLDYDGDGRVSTERQYLASIPANPQEQPDDPRWTIGHSYDTLGREFDTTYPAEYGVVGATARHVQDILQPGGLLAQLTVTNIPYLTTRQFNATGQPEQVVLGNGSVEQSKYDPDTGALSEQLLTAGSRTLLSLAYDRFRPGTREGRTGQVTSFRDPSDKRNTQSYRFDAVGRLATAQQVGGVGSGWMSDLAELLNGISPIQIGQRTGWRQDYDYDRYGNRSGVSFQSLGGIADGPPELKADPATNRIVEAGYAYDGAGNLVRGRGPAGRWQGYQYDQNGRLAAVSDDAGHVIERYAYAPTGDRLYTEDAQTGVRTYYAVSGGQLLAEYQSTKGSDSTFSPLQWLNSRIYWGTRLVATIESNAEQIYFYHPDMRGSRLVTDQSASIVKDLQSMPFGVTEGAAGVPVGSALDTHMSAVGAPLFSTYERSPRTGLDYAVNRFYDSRLGRFLQPDGLGIAAASLDDADSFNLYAYAANDPIDRSDPTGLLWIESTGCVSVNDDPETCTTYWDWYPDPVPWGDDSPAIPLRPGAPAPKSKTKSPNACGDQAQVAQNLANYAITATSNPGDALNLFNQLFSQLYVGKELDVATGLDLYTHPSLPGREIPSFDYSLGETGFLPQFLDTDISSLRNPDSNPDQTHHLATYLSGGINSVGWKRPFLRAMTARHESRDNSGDAALGEAAYSIGRALANDPKSLASIGNTIQNTICK